MDLISAVRSLELGTKTEVTDALDNPRDLREIRRKLNSQLYQSAYFSPTVASLLAALFYLTAKDGVPFFPLLAWLVLTVIINGVRQSMICSQMKKLENKGLSYNLHRAFIGLSVVSVLVWAALPAALFPHGDPELQFLICLLVIGVAAGASVVLSAHFALAQIYVFGTISPLAWQLLWGQSSFQLVAGCFSIMFILSLSKAISFQHRTLLEFLELQAVRERLTKDLEERNSKMQELNNELAKALEEALRSSTHKNEFLAHVSHEIRTPLNSILGVSELILEESQESHVREYLNGLRSSTSTLLTVVNDLLDLSKAEAGKLKLSPKLIGPEHELSRLTRIYELEAAEKDLRFEVKIDSQLPELIVGDWPRISQILSNLLSNAIKFTPSQGVVSLSAVVVKNTPDATQIKFTVEDTGIGIPEDQQATIFDSFVQADNGMDRAYGGTGVGLAIAKKLAKLMNGRLSVESTPDAGSKFTFEATFPVPKIDPRQPSEAEVELADLEPLRILLAEDNITNSRLTTRILEKAGHRVAQAFDGTEVLELLDSEQFDLILMDCQMPKLDGYATTEAIRSNEPCARSRVPIIALTAHALDGDRERCLQAGMDEYVSKPIRRQALAQAIRRVVITTET